MHSPLATSKPYPCSSGHREPLGWVVNLVGHTAGPGAFLIASDSSLALLTCFLFLGNGVAKPGHQLFYQKGVCRDADGNTVVPQEVDFRGGGQHLGLGVGMELNCLGWGEPKPLRRK